MTQHMSSDCLLRAARAPAQFNVFPRYPATVLAGLIDLFADEGYPLLEILGRPMDDALAILAELNKLPQRARIDIAVGTVITRKDAERAAALKPEVLVSPAFSRSVLNVAVHAGIAYLPGVSTLQDVQMVLDAFEDVGRELRVLKVCPIDFIGRENMKYFAGIYPGILFSPTGDVRPEEIPTLKAQPWMGVPMQAEYIAEELIANQEWDAIREILRRLRRLAEEGEANRP